jgi:putative two-component system response regulator
MVDDATLKGAQILIVDDERPNVLLLEHILRASGYANLGATTDSSQVLELCARVPPDLVVLDLDMPDPDGFEVMEQLDAWFSSRWLPVLALSADATPAAKKQALSSGAKDFLLKPLDADEVLLRIENLLEIRFLQLQVRKQSILLERHGHEQPEDMGEARIEILKRLALAAEYRDDATGEHTQRVGRTSALLAVALGLDDDEVELIRSAATLHDLGKVGIPDRILLKPGKLDPDELEVMKSHVHLGARILSGTHLPLLVVAEQVALTHHEWWDGHGYPAGMRGEAIPLAGRIVAIADVFDALTHDRPYKKDSPLEAALIQVRDLSGSQFDPRVVEAFETLDPHDLLAPIESGAFLSSHATGAQSTNGLPLSA